MWIGPKDPSNKVRKMRWRRMMLRKMRWRMMMLRMMRCRKSARAQKLGPYFVRACLAERQFNNSQEALSTQNYRQNAAVTNLEPHFVRACAVELQLKFSQEPLCTEIYRKNARAKHRPLHAFTPTIRNPQCGHTVWGKKTKYDNYTTYQKRYRCCLTTKH